MKKFFTDVKNSFILLELGFKTYMTINIAFLVMEFFFPQVASKLRYTTVQVVHKYQYWRLFTSFLINGRITFMKLLYFLVNLLFLNISIRQLQKKYSTIYIIIEILKQNFIVNLLLTLIYFPFMAFGLLQTSAIFTQGIIIVTINFTIHMASINMEKTFNLCFMELKLKYLPWIMLIVLVNFFTNSLLTFTTTFVFCMIQHYFLSKPLVALPLVFYEAIQNILPNLIVSSRGYVRVGHCDSLREVCHIQFKSSANQSKKPSVISSFQQHWKQKQFDPPAQSNKIKQNDVSSNQIEGNFQRVEQPNEIEIKCDLSISEVIQYKQIDYQSHWKSKNTDNQEINQHLKPLQNYRKSIKEVVENDTPNKQSQQKFEDFQVTSQHRNIVNETQQQQSQQQKYSSSNTVGKIAPAEEQQQWY